MGRANEHDWTAGDLAGDSIRVPCYIEITGFKSRTPMRIQRRITVTVWVGFVSKAWEHSCGSRNSSSPQCTVPCFRNDKVCLRVDGSENFFLIPVLIGIIDKTSNSLPQFFLFGIVVLDVVLLDHPLQVFNFFGWNFYGNRNVGIVAAPDTTLVKEIIICLWVVNARKFYQDFYRFLAIAWRVFRDHSIQKFFLRLLDKY